MNVIVLGDKYDKGKKSQGSQALINYKTNTKYIDYQYRIIQEYYPRANFIYVYGLGEKKFLSYYTNSKNLKKIHIIYNSDYDTKNEVYSLFLCKNKIISDDNTIIINGNTNIKKNHMQKIGKSTRSSVFLAKDNSQSEIGCVHNKDDVLNISYSLDTKIDNIYYISKNDQIIFNEFIDSSSNHNRFLFEIFNLMIDKKVIINLV